MNTFINVNLLRVKALLLLTSAKFLGNVNGPTFSIRALFMHFFHAFIPLRLSC